MEVRVSLYLISYWAMSEHLIHIFTKQPVLAQMKYFINSVQPYANLSNSMQKNAMSTNMFTSEPHIVRDACVFPLETKLEEQNLLLFKTCYFS